MSEKRKIQRFNLDDRGYDGFDIYDSTGEYKESELFIGMSLQQIVDCLNKLNDENEEYAKIIEQCKRYEDGLWVRFTKLEKENEQLRVLLKEAEQEIDRLKKSNLEFMKTLVNKESEKEDNQETEVRECQFCGEFRTEYHEYEDYSWSAEDYCNAGHDLEDTDPNSCKDYWDK